MLQSVLSIISYALDFQRVNYTYVLITTDLSQVGKITCELVKHFHNNGCDFGKDLRVYILEDNFPPSKTSL